MQVGPSLKSPNLLSKRKKAEFRTMNCASSTKKRVGRGYINVPAVLREGF
jgi:hypothetical protein